MKELLIRAISGLVYVAALAGTALWNPIAFAVVVLVFFVVANYELLKLTGPKNLNKHIFTAFFGSSLIMLIVLMLDNFGFWYFSYYYETLIRGNFELLRTILFVSFLLSMILFFVLLGKSLSNKMIATDLLKSFSLHIIYLLIPFLVIIFLAFQGSFDFKFPFIVLLFAIIWINDTFAYLGGKLFGKTPLAPKISPKKTVEGLISGVIFAIAAALIYNYFEPFSNNVFLSIFVVLICGTATLGDLLQSKLKREAGVKDSGNLIPGHGGMLDRMDSILLTAPLTLFYLIILFL